jgi:hypothetical protein
MTFPPFCDGLKFSELTIQQESTGRAMPPLAENVSILPGAETPAPARGVHRLDGASRSWSPARSRF